MKKTNKASFPLFQEKSIELTKADLKKLKGGTLILGGDDLVAY